MAVLKYYDGTGWEPVVSALQGPTGDAGAVYQDNEPTDTGVLWVDTDDDGFLVVPNGGATGAVLTKQSSADYDTGWDLPVNSGLVHIETQSFSGVSSFDFSTGIFSSTYDNYKIVFKGLGSTQADLTYRMLLAGSPNSTTNYDSQTGGFDNTSTSISRTTNATSGRFSYIGSGAPNMAIVYVQSPYLAERTITRTVSAPIDATNIFIRDFATMHKVASSFDSFQVLISTGTFTGTASVYGWKK